MIVCKFGGTSMASGHQFHKVKHVLDLDDSRKIVVVSAPGKRFASDQKVTDLLIEAFYEGPSSKSVALIIQRFEEIREQLSLPEELVEQLTSELHQRLLASQGELSSRLDAVKAIGEEFSARFFAAFLKSLGRKSRFADPAEIGIYMTASNQRAQLLDESYEMLKKLKDTQEIVVVPGFYGYTKDGVLRTFERGGSDITGSILAAAVQADLYENFTDVDFVYAANPNIIESPQQIEEITYREMRELSYAGFTVIHDEALMPVYRKQIPVAIKNTNNPDAPGTKIVAFRPLTDQPVTGLTADQGFSILYVSKYLMNRELGFGRKLLQIIEEEGISYEHTPSGLDDISVIIRSHYLDSKKEQRIVYRVLHELGAEVAYFKHGLSMIVLVGEGMRNSTGLAARATAAISDTGANIEMINQGSSEVSLVFGVLEQDQVKIVHALYDAFFSRVKVRT
ncbi:aspartate kinase [Chryseomicrobium sp. FSL W7-1435]|uniref:aspartate kinase n=1 Tax=Chryseomicrobium sp. FSL W7-1435 TaxID=2921704 RepID=UPI00315B32DC